jgi:hypothetical protein
VRVRTAMDPLSALSVTGTVALFVQFTSALFSGARKISNSVSDVQEKMRDWNLYALEGVTLPWATPHLGPP